MADIAMIAVVILFLLALIDLSVGVSNDAVNFLNSAIGSRVASRRTILIVASAGIIVGALFSSGIMEVARKGIFNPEMFTFADVMVLFLAVMLADVLLLDLFNTLGMPTSTTVSIVFELLGAATAIAIMVVISQPDSAPFIDYINASSAATIIAGIALSVVVAFTIGSIVQFFSRLVFTFDKERHGFAARVVWSAIAFTVISYFLFIKGLKGAAFISDDTVAYVQSHIPLLMLAGFVFWLIVSIIIRRLGFNPLAGTVLGGTFALAMAFASNDLVNFIGVPLAGLSSWQAWSASGVPADSYTMDVLREPVRSGTLYLVGAGVVMAVTLWVSSKARSVTKTEVNLGRQDEGSERFRPGPVSRGLVRAVLNASAGVRAVVPAQWQTRVADRFQRESQAARVQDSPAFDLVRASVNLAVASILIAYATSLKLPLSTTFVSFMVAMGTSLADRAWGRDSATYRVAGVLSVLTGWFMTALVAFSMAALFAVLLKSFGMAALAVLVALVVFSLYHTFRYHGEKEARESASRTLSAASFTHHGHLLREQLSELLVHASSVIDLALRGLNGADRKLLDRSLKELKELKASVRRKELVFTRLLKRDRPDVDGQFLGQLQVLACQQDLYQSTEMIVDTARSHVLNAHESPTTEVTGHVDAINRRQQELASALREECHDGNGSCAIGMDGIEQSLDMIEVAVDTVTHDLYDNHRPIKNSTILLTLFTELADFMREIDRAQQLCARHVFDDKPLEQLDGEQPAPEAG